MKVARLSATLASTTVATSRSIPSSRSAAASSRGGVRFVRFRDPGVRVGADERAGAVLPLGDQLPQGPDVLVLAGGEGGLLPHLDDFAGGGLPAVGRGERLDEVVLGGLDRARALGEVLPQRLRDAVDLPLRLGRAAALLRRPAPAELGGQLVGEDPVVQLGHADRGPVERLGVEGAPRPVGDGLDAVEDDDVGVQLRVAGAGVPVVERGRDDAADVLLNHAALAHPGGEDLALAVGDDRLQRAAVGGVDPGAGGVVGERPRDRDGLRRGEGQVETGDGLRRLLRPPEVVDGLRAAGPAGPGRAARR